MEKNKGLMRLFYATLYSWQGFKSAWLNEAAFRQELVFLITMTAVSFVFDVSAVERFAMIASIMLILIVELINSAIECVVDRISTERHILSGRAKDYGSLAVLLSVFIAIATWLVILLN